MSAVPIGKRGRILAGKHAGWDIFVEPDGVDTGSYLILYINPNANEGFDDWAINVDLLQLILDDMEVDWSFFDGKPEANYHTAPQRPD